MERGYQIVEWDGWHFSAVLTYWTQPNTVAGTVWRLVMDQGKTLVVVPHQSPEPPAPEAHLAPGRIVSVLSGGSFGLVVRRVASANIHTERRWGQMVGRRVESNLNYWIARQSFPAIEKLNEANSKAHAERREQWKNAGLASGDEEAWKGTSEEWLAARTAISSKILAPLEKLQRLAKPEHERIESQRANIEKQWLAKTEKAKSDRAAEIEKEVLEELRESLAGYGAKARGKKWLKELYDFIRDDVCSGNRINPLIGDVALRQVLAKIEELTGADITEGVIESSPFVKAAMFNDAALQEILDRVRWVAEFPDGRKYLVESVSTDTHAGRDAELFELVKPTEEERENIGQKIEEAMTAEYDRKLSEAKKTVVEFSNNFRTIKFLSPDGATIDSHDWSKSGYAQKILRHLFENKGELLDWEEDVVGAIQVGNCPAWDNGRDPVWHLSDHENNKGRKKVLEKLFDQKKVGDRQKIRLREEYKYRLM